MYSILLIGFYLLAAGCSVKHEPSILNRHAEVLLTNKNELQFRFKINEKVFTDETMYRVKVSIHDEQLAAALGQKEILYGSKEVFAGKALNVSESKESFIYMEPMPLMMDLHVFDIEKMITDQKAISVEIISKDKVIAQTFLTRFATQL
ncbi:hypothetical protein [Bacillus tuaregi]|uniref:hypothetical protein n=1 Tax=Bacillus tuaregi TaxID=1816695 RepID=UPI0008F918A6|nr:hypothetical protein [Bacillus tuaregi]